MDFLRKIVKDSLLLAENVQLADKVYFNTGKLSPEVKKYILHITGGDAWTKLISDIYYAEVSQWKKQGAWAVSVLNEPDEPEEEPTPDGQDDVMNVADWKRIKAMYLQLKAYNKNQFPIKGLNINGVQDVWELIRALKERATILEEMKKLPSVAWRNMRNEIRQERTDVELRDYRDLLQQFTAYYSMLSNRDPKFRKAIENKMFIANITLEDLYNFAQDKENMVGGKPFTRNSIKRLVGANSYDMEIVYEKGNVMVIDITSPEAIKKIGCNSLWCFTYGTAYQQASTNWPRYSTNDHVYVIIDFSLPSDSTEFMHVLIKPLDYKTPPSDEGDVNDSKLFNMANEESYNALGVIQHLIGDQAPYILHFDEPVDVEGPNSKWPYEDPNQLKLDLKEFRKLIRKVLGEL
jgi:hypothetical protein